MARGAASLECCNGRFEESGGLAACPCRGAGSLCRMGVIACDEADARRSDRRNRDAVSPAPAGIAPPARRPGRRRPHARGAAPSVAMTPLDHAVRDITRALESLSIRYAIIGGIANAVW